MTKKSNDSKNERVIGHLSQNQFRLLGPGEYDKVYRAYRASDGVWRITIEDVDMRVSLHYPNSAVFGKVRIDGEGRVHDCSQLTVRDAESGIRCAVEIALNTWARIQVLYGIDAPFLFYEHCKGMGCTDHGETRVGGIYYHWGYNPNTDTIYVYYDHACRVLGDELFDNQPPAKMPEAISRRVCNILAEQEELLSKLQARTQKLKDCCGVVTPSNERSNHVCRRP